jgi:heterodisulfide reductase subunit A-like polyferredoxin
MSELTKKKVGAVMVVGGGIAGMQSALDLANSGFKVYLVERTSSIGGRMAQLDKTFPTNDCSMCMISPKLIEVAKHRNIEIITNAQLEALDGEAGNFSAKILIKPRYIDLNKCTGCGDCISACPVELKNEFEQGLSKCKATSRRYPQAIPGAFAITKGDRPPCKLTCPAGCNGQGYIALTGKGKYLEAFDHIKQWIPLPASVGRICHHPCEQQCNRGHLDEPLGIAPIKAFVADIVRRKRKEGTLAPEILNKIDPSKPKIAVVGSGPSGLTCAGDLAKKGYQVSLFEASSAPGGQLQWAIPQYRLPREALKADIQEIIGLGIELKLNTPIKDNYNLAYLKAQGYQAIYLAIGAQKSRNLSIPGSDLPGVLLALDFLKEVTKAWPVKIGNKVVVVGGGNVAMDVARSARRLGASEVHVFCLEARSEMPAHTWEIEEAEEEGIQIHNSWGPRAIQARDRRVASIEFIKCTSVFNQERKFDPQYDTNITSIIECDTVIVAIGQAAELSVLSHNTTIKTTRAGLIAADPLTLATGEPGIFAGGDGVSGPKSAVEAIAHGHEAAISIERYLNGQDLKQGRENVAEKPASLPEGQHIKQKRVPLRKIDMTRRLSSFDEINLLYSEDEARRESERCLNCGLCSECLQCAVVCQAKAVDHTQKAERLEIKVGSVVLAPGFDPFDAKIKGEYGYGRMPNVVTSLEFERILSASGPYQGQVRRPSDGRHPVKIGWIQCVGSRDQSCGRDYCSSVCCMYATKEAIIAKEHENAIQPTIFYNDIRAYGKNFERYYESARNKFGVRYINSIPSGVKELQKSHNLLLEYTGDDGKKVQEEFDLVVLSVGMVPAEGSNELAEKVGVQLDRFGFCDADKMNPGTTSRPGVFVAGAFTGPIDIPESVVSASGAACLAGENIREERGTLVTEKVYPPETEVDGEPRVGVFVCRCGSNIARVINVPEVVKYAASIPNVVHAEENLYTCSTDTQEKLIRAIKEKDLNRVVVASCSPRTHEPLFQDTIREGGLNKYLFEMANIRDQCSWVHATHMPESTDKAKDLVRMAVARSITLLPLHQQRAEVTRRALIIGGGVSGMVAAREIAAQGYEAVLIERDRELGGNLRHIYFTHHKDPQEFFRTLVSKVESDPRIKIYRGATVKKVSGFLGNYMTEIATENGAIETIKNGVVIIATGGIEYKPVEYLYGQSLRVVTQLELEEKLFKKTLDFEETNSVVMIQCVGSREPEHQYCSRICCSQAVNNAIKLKEAKPEMDVSILYRDMRTYGLRELKYRKARELGVTFIHFDEAHKPQVTQDGKRLRVVVQDKALNREIVLEPALLVLSAAIRPQPDAAEFARLLKLSLTQDQFVMEAHMKLRPLDLVNEGMYVCGLAHSPKKVSESIIQARGAVSRALTVLSQPYLMVGGIVSVVDPDKCVACLTCVRACPYDVPRINEEGVSYIEPAACQGCGICAGVCPRKAITLQNYSDEQVMAKTRVMVEAVAESK